MNREWIKQNKDIFSAWVNGAEIQYYIDSDDIWVCNLTPNFNPDFKWRIKPTPKKRLITIEELKKDGALFLVDKRCELWGIESIMKDSIVPTNGHNATINVIKTSFKGYITAKDYMNGNYENVKSFEIDEQA